MEKVRFNCDDLEPYYGYGHPQFLNQPQRDLFYCYGEPPMRGVLPYPPLPDPLWKTDIYPYPPHLGVLPYPPLPDVHPNPFVTTGLVVEQKVER